MAKLVYVKGSIRKDAVEITHKECRVSEARVLETLYGSAWTPYQLRTVEVVEVPHAAEELDRLGRLYGQDVIEKSWGHPAQARQAITELFGLDTPAKVKKSGILVENEAIEIDLIDDAKAPAKRAKKGEDTAVSDESPDPSQAVA